MGSMGSLPVEHRPAQDAIVKGGAGAAQHQGPGFASVGSIAVAMEPIGHGIVKGGAGEAKHQGPGFASSGSLEMEHVSPGHGIIRGGAVAKEGPADAGSDQIAEHIHARQAAQYDPERERKVRAFLEGVLETKFEEASLMDALKSGERLCEALNKCYPGSVAKINKSKIAFLQIENIGNYIQGCRTLGFNKSLLFETPDLFENRNPTIVVDNIFELSQMVAKGK